ncbi:hypothetical protein CE91St44_12680 [Oscillospiraceae bacterium]|nr:hypothetical protein CE91St44_12680 [Oscillospiraceae bacterium]
MRMPLPCFLCPRPPWGGAPWPPWAWALCAPRRGDDEMRAGPLAGRRGPAVPGAGLAGPREAPWLREGPWAGWPWAPVRFSFRPWPPF